MAAHTRYFGIPGLNAALNSVHVLILMGFKQKSILSILNKVMDLIKESI